MTSPMGDSVRVGGTRIDVDLELDRKGIAAFRSQVRAATSSAAKAASASLKQELGNLPQLDHSGLTKGQSQQLVRAQRNLRRTTRIYQAEADSWKKLQGQRASVYKAASANVEREMDRFSRRWDANVKANERASLAGTRAASDFSNEMNRMFANAVRAGTGLDQVSRKSVAVSSSSKGMLDHLYSAGTAMSQLATRTGMLGYQMQLLGRMATTFISLPIAATVGGAAYLGLKTAAQIEQAMKGMVALRPNENIVPFFDRMLTLAKVSPVFEAGPLLDSIRGLAAANIPTKKIEELVNAMGRIGITVGAEGYEMTLAFKALEEMGAKGKVSMEELRRQLGNSIPGVMALISEGLGISIRELFAQVEGGMAPEKIFQGLINVANSPRFLEGATTGVQSLNSAFQGLIETTRISLGEQFLDENFRVKPEVTKGLQELTKSIKILIDSAGEAGLFDGLINGFTKFVDLITRGIDKYKSLSDAQRDLIPKLLGVAAAIGPVMMAVAPLFSVMGMLMNTMATFGIALGGIANPAGAAAIAIIGVTAAATALFVILVAKSETFRNKMISVAQDAAGFFDRYLVPAFDRLVGELTNLGRELDSIGIDWALLGDVIKGTAYIVIGTWGVAIQSAATGLRIFRTSVAATAKLAELLLMAFEPVLRVLAKVVEWAGRMGMVPSYLEDLPKDMNGLADASGKGAEALRGFSTAGGDVEGTSFSLTNTMGGLADMFGKNTEKAGGLSDAVDTLRNKLREARGEAANNIDVDDRYQQALLSLDETIKRSGTTLDAHTRAGQDNRAALKAATQASADKTLQDIKSGMPMERAIQKHRDRVKALEAEFGKTKKTRDEARKLIGAYDDIPKNVRTLLEMLGYKDINQKLLEMSVRQRALKEGKSFEVLWNKEKKLAQMNKKGYSTGGWTGPGHKFKPAGVVHADEHVIQKESRRKMERANPGLLDYINRSGQLPPQYADGGKVVKWPFPIDVSKTMIKDSWGLPQIGDLVGGGGAGGPGGFTAMFNWLKSAMGGRVSLASGYRPGAWGYHGLGRAVDLTFPDGSERSGGGLALKAFNLIKSNFFKSIKELIWDFAGSQAVWNGQNHFFTGPDAGPGTHNDHIHWAHDNGGPLYDGMLTRNSSGQTETVLNAAQGKAFEDKIKGSGQQTIIVQIGNEEFKGYIRTEVRNEKRETISALKRGRGRG